MAILRASVITGSQPANRDRRALSSVTSRGMALGIAFALIAAVATAAMNAAVKGLGGDASLPVILLFRFTLSFLVVAPFAVKAVDFHIGPLGLYAVRVVSALLAICCMFTAVSHAPLTSVLLLNSTTPLFVPILAAVFFGISTPIGMYLGIIVGFGGVVLVLSSGPDLFSNWGEWLALLSGLFAATSMVAMRALTRTEPATKVMLIYYGVGALVCLIWATSDWHWPDTSVGWLLLLSVGILGTIYQVAVTYAVVHAPSRLVTPLAFTSVIWGAGLDLSIWGVVPHMREFAGFAVVVIGIGVVLHYGRKHLTSKAEPPAT